MLKALLRSKLGGDSKIHKKILESMFKFFELGLLDVEDLLIAYMYSVGLSLKEISFRLHRSQNFSAHRMKKMENLLKFDLGSFMYKDFIKVIVADEIQASDNGELQFIDDLINSLVEDRL